MKTCEVFTFRPVVYSQAKIVFAAQQAVCQECIGELKVANLLNIHPLHHPLCTMLVPFAFDQAEQIAQSGSTRSCTSVEEDMKFSPARFYLYMDL